MGSTPSIGTNILSENEGFTESCTDSAQKTAEEGRKVKFPQIIRHRRVEAKIYGKKPDYHGHIEVSKSKSKTRQRRLAEIVPALSQWLEPFRELTGKLWIGDPKFNYRRNENFFHKSLNAVCEQAGVTRKENGLRHSFCTFHFALHSNENLTAAQAGNSPAMIHAHYKGLATKSEAE